MLTHQGRSSSSGHYLAWIRRKGGNSVCCSLSNTRRALKLICLILLDILPASLATYSRESKRPENVTCILLTQTTKRIAYFFQTSYKSELFARRFSVLDTKDCWVYYKKVLRKIYDFFLSHIPVFLSINDPQDKTNDRETRKITILGALCCRWVGKVRWWQHVDHHNRTDSETLRWRYVL